MKKDDLIIMIICVLISLVLVFIFQVKSKELKAKLENPQQKLDFQTK